MSGVPGTPNDDGKPWNLQQILSEIQEGRLHSCGALVEALKIAENDNSRSKILHIMNDLSYTEMGRAALIAARRLRSAGGDSAGCRSRRLKISY